MSQPLKKRGRRRLLPEAYKELHQKVLRRDGWRCQSCGRSEELQVHHLEARSQLGEDSEENLVTLCAGCHRAVHRRGHSRNLRSARQARDEEGEKMMAAGNGSAVWAQPAQLRLASGTYLRCPNCNSTDLKKVSLAYQEGLFYTVARTRLRGVGVGGSGPNLLIGKATTRGFYQSALSKQLSPPVKWSYRKLIRCWVLLFLSTGWIVFYASAVTGSSSAVLSPPLILLSLFSAATFLLLLILFWRHNRSAYKRQYSRWERSLLCQRCGTLTEQE